MAGKLARVHLGRGGEAVPLRVGEQLARGHLFLSLPRRFRRRGRHGQLHLQMLVAGTAAFGAAWGLGGIVGPPLVGGVMTRVGPSGLPFTLAIVFTVLVVVNAAPRMSSRNKAQ